MTEAPADPNNASFAVVVCTRNRADHLARLLAALDAQTEGDFPLVVVDQSDETLPHLTERERAGAIRVLRDAAPGLSRARNRAWRELSTPWVVYLDDDCLPPPDWAGAMRRALAANPEAAFLTGDVGENGQENTEGLVVTTFRVERRTVRSGRWTWPWAIGFGVCMAIRRDWIERLDGWDERLGAGVPDLPASEDMDFNYRLLRAGGVAVAVPEVRVLHDQWRTPGELPALHRGYATGWAGFASKQLRTGDVVGGLWLWGWGAFGCARMFASALRRRSRLRLKVARALLEGHLMGTARGLRRRW